MVALKDAILKLYPTAKIGLGGTVTLEQGADGISVISKWDDSLGAQPSSATLAAVVLDASTTKAQAKQAALFNATATGFTLDQVRIIRAVVLLLTGTAPQKAKAQILLAPLLQLCNDAKAVSAAIDADAVPLPIVPPILGTDDP